MSAQPPPEPPTRRLDPVAGAPVYERVVEPGVPVGADPGLLFVRLEDRIASLRTVLVFVAVIAVLGVGLAIYALTRVDNGSAGTNGGASSASITRLNDRVDRLSRQVQSARSAVRGISTLSQRVDALSKTVAGLRTAASTGAAAPDATQAIQDLSKRIDALDQRVQDLSQGQTTTP
jgi:outer membrane murein-binding lipoprotein Lpp